MRPTLLPALRRLWRDRSTVQFGVDPVNATTLEFSGPGSAAVLNLLDGTRTQSRVVREAGELGWGQADVSRLVESLAAAGVLTDAAALTPTDIPENTRRRLGPELAALSLRSRPADRTPAAIVRRRRRSRLLIRGRGPMTAVIGALTAAAGLGRVDIEVTGTVTYHDLAVGGLAADDLGRPRSVAAVDAVRRVAPEVDTRPLRNAVPDLTILVGAPQPGPATALAYARRRTPHLAVWVRDGVAVIGPLVRPGRSTCLDCVALHRQARDGHWPLLASQLATSPRHDDPAEAPVVLLGAAMAAVQALCQLDGGRPATVGGSLEIMPSGQVRRRTWPPHPRCGCIRRSRARRVSLAEPPTEPASPAGDTGL